VPEQLAHVPTGRDANRPIHPRDGTRCAMGCTFRKPLTPKRFFRLSTETVHRYLLLLFLYI